MKDLFYILLVLLTTAGCQRGTSEIDGIWVQPIPGQPGEQGICLRKGGEAASVNMQTLVYKSWKQAGMKLILNGESIGNHQTFSFSDTLTIRKLTADSLILDKGGWRMAYTRKK